MGSRSGQGDDTRSDREKRLAEALRANLRRRKAQQRQRTTAPDNDGRRRSKDESNEESG